MSKYYSLAVETSIETNFDSEKFIKMRMRVCHDGENPNGTKFSLETIEAAKETIKNIPVLAHVIKDENGEYQFGGHDFTTKLDEDGITLEYEELPIGVIPETNNYAIEEHDGRQYVCVDAYIWRGYSNYAERIIDRDKDIKLSMEIDIEDFAEPTEGSGAIEITKYKYLGITLLNKNIGTGMIDALAMSTTFSQSNMTAKFISILEELNKEIADYSAKLSTDADNGVQETADVSTGTGDVSDQEVFDNTDGAIGEDTGEGAATEGEVFTENSTDDNTSNDNSEMVVTFSYPLDTIYAQLYSLLQPKSCFILEVSAEAFYYIDEGKYYKQNYSSAGNGALSLEGDAVEVMACFESPTDFEEFANWKEKASEYEQLKAEVEKLREYKANIESQALHAQKMDVISKWSVQLNGIEAFETLKKEIDSYSIEQIEVQCKCIYADTKVVFSLKDTQSKSNAVIGIDMAHSDDTNDYDPYNGLFSEYGI